MAPPGVAFDTPDGGGGGPQGVTCAGLRTSIRNVATDPASTAVLFPGQGSQTSGMAAVAAAHAPQLLSQAREELGADPFEQIAAGTHFAQPAI